MHHEKLRNLLIICLTYKMLYICTDIDLDLDTLQYYTFPFLTLHSRVSWDVLKGRAEILFHR